MTGRVLSDDASEEQRAGGPLLLPCLMIQGGRVVVPSESGPSIARTPTGAPFEIFDVLDALRARYPRLYVVDLDGVEREDPQLDYLQELARDAEVWVDAGVRSSDQAIDALVTGANRVVLSSSVFGGEEELVKSWGLSKELTFELALRGGRVEARHRDWKEIGPEELAQRVRAVGLRDLIVSPRDGVVPWELVGRLSEGGPTWVDGPFDLSEAPRLSTAGAAGGIFHLEGNLLTTPEGSPWRSFSIPSPGRRDDET